MGPTSLPSKTPFICSTLVLLLSSCIFGRTAAEGYDLTNVDCRGIKSGYIAGFDKLWYHCHPDTCKVSRVRKKGNDVYKSLKKNTHANKSCSLTLECFCLPCVLRMLHSLQYTLLASFLNLTAIASGCIGLYGSLSCSLYVAVYVCDGMSVYGP